MKLAMRAIAPILVGAGVFTIGLMWPETPNPSSRAPSCRRSSMRFPARRLPHPRLTNRSAGLFRQPGLAAP